MTTTNNHWSIQCVAITNDPPPPNHQESLILAIAYELATIIPIKIIGDPITMRGTTHINLIHKTKTRTTTISTISPFSMMLKDDTITISDHPQTIQLHDPHFLTILARITLAIIKTHYRTKIANLKRTLKYTTANMNSLKTKRVAPTSPGCNKHAHTSQNKEY